MPSKQDIVSLGVSSSLKRIQSRMYPDEVSSGNDGVVAYTLLRLTLGTNIAMHGLSRLTAGPNAFADKLLKQFAPSSLPPILVHLFGQALPWVECLFGLLLLLGLRTRAALIGGASLILVLTFGSSLVQDWQAASIQLTYAAVYAALLGLLRFNRWSLDALMFRKESERVASLP